MTQFGYFDDAAREYVITRPDTPQPWTNYSGDRRYGAVYSHHATGYAFTHSPSKGHLLRYSFVAPPASQPGRYFYLRDAEDGDFWSASWRPVAKPLSDYKSTCHMGTAYMVLRSEYRQIAMETSYFVPLGQEFEMWLLRVTNRGSTQRELDVFSYAEFSSVWDVVLDEFNQQYANAVSQCQLVDGMAGCGNMPHLPVKEDFGAPDQSRWCYMLQAGDVAPCGFDFERDRFLGSSGSYAAPEAVLRGACSQSEAYADTACGVFQSRLSLAPGESKSLVVILGAGRAETVGRTVRETFGSVARAEEELRKLKAHWHGRLNHVTAETPDPAFNSMLNVWGAYNALMTFEWSRSCSLVYSGLGRDGFGYRDTVQDILGVLPSIPELARERLLLMLSGQESAGGAQPVVDPVFFKPGTMPKMDPARQRADDCLWLFNTVPAYVAETGDRGFYQRVVPFADSGEGTVLEHLRRALDFSLHYRGEHGLTCGLHADWNDCLILGFRGESVFVSLQLRLALDTYARIADAEKLPEEAAWARKQLAEVDGALQRHAWDGAWFRRAITEDGTLVGSAQSPEGQIFLNPQSWSVLSGAATPEQAEAAMEAVDRRLVTGYGLALHDSPYEKTGVQQVQSVLYLKGVKENAGVFQHTQGWAVIADCMLGHGARAYRNFRAYLPAAQNDRAEIREIEPYVYAQWTHTHKSPKHGRSRLPWLSGTAAWSYFAATHHILGLRPEENGLRIDPCIPPEWTAFTMSRVFRRQRIHISVDNPRGVERGVMCLRFEDGRELSGGFLPLNEVRDDLRVTAVMGPSAPVKKGNNL
ncbi:MAG: N,N'-diacetylchitobiose phosphorylase [Verrucomicrobia bacterium]|nr:N,N'-diacetylchitobiose phosphorylase [Verrucomicrobiota bacterium]MCH8528027.1 N,N'-diacetylchitobiose phosphorylase [Kiritimatiellia bacterium]